MNKRDVMVGNPVKGAEAEGKGGDQKQQSEQSVRYGIGRYPKRAKCRQAGISNALPRSIREETETGRSPSGKEIASVPEERWSESFI